MAEVPVLGLDVGGSKTRALLATTSGRRLAAVAGPGGNPVSHGEQVAADRMAEVIVRVLAEAEIDAADVAACALGLSGGHPDLPTIDELGPRTGLRCRIEMVSDVTLAFVAGTPATNGTILLAGTGAVASRVVDRALSDPRDGHGWLLGDDGSGFWIGRQAVRRTLAALEGSAPHSPLTEAVIEAYFAGGTAVARAVGERDGTGFGRAVPRNGHEMLTALINEVHRRPPVALAAHTTLVTEAHDLGDPAAATILREAAECLVTTLRRAGPEPNEPIVLAGGVLGRGSLVRCLVADAVAAHWPEAPIATAGDGAGAAAWLAAGLLGDGADEERLHTLIVAHRALPDSPCGCRRG
jgi:glucosamine kinase